MQRQFFACNNADSRLSRCDVHNENIDGLLMERHMAKVARRSAKHHLKGPAKRTEEDDRRFEESFRRLLEQEDGR